MSLQSREVPDTGVFFIRSILLQTLCNFVTTGS
jgi:hypothetical protein